MTYNMNTPVSRIAFAGDWHANTQYAVEEIRSVPDVDMILHLGDFGFNFQKLFVDALTNALEETDTMLAFVDGNHDNHEYLAELPTNEHGVRHVSDRIIYLPRGFRWKWDDVSFLALGGAYSVDSDGRMPGVSWWEGETISTSDAYRAMEGGMVDVMLTHDVFGSGHVPGMFPGGVLPERHLMKAQANRDILSHVVEEVRPTMLFHGHYHARYTQLKDGIIVTGLAPDGDDFDENLFVVDMTELVEMRDAVRHGDLME